MAAYSETIPRQDQVDARLPVEGFVILKSPLSEEQRQKLVKSITDQVLYQVYGRKCINFDYEDPNHINSLSQALSDKKHRDNILGISATDTVWRKDNTRDPVWSKTTGMIDIHYNLDVLSLVALNPEVYATLSHYYGYSKLVHSVGIEKVCFKAAGSTAMEEHIDTNLFDDTVNYPCRLQALLCHQMDTEIAPKYSGSIEVLKHLQLYWYLARALFHPVYGPVPFPKNSSSSVKGSNKGSITGSRFHVLDRK